MPLYESIPLNTPCEMINVTPINPLISKCQIKVCYVGDEPNRNRSIITKDVAKELANSLPGSPIVGYYDEASGDFEEHNRTIEISNGKLKFKDTTQPYGFVDLGAKVWFQKFQEGDNEREYLVTEGYLWTGQYPECKRVIEKGNNQSMELDDKIIDAHWTKDENGKPQFFIINEAIISKLCILGENFEPCFEGSQIFEDSSSKVQFSFEDDFKQQLFSMMTELKDLLENKGGENSVFNTYAVEIGCPLWDCIYDYLVKTYPDSNVDWPESIYRIEGIFEREDGSKFMILNERKDRNKFFQIDFSYTETEGFVPNEQMIEVSKTYVPTEKPQFSLEEVEAYALKKKEAAMKKKEPKDEPEEDICPDCGKPVSECECEDKKKKKDKKDKYVLEEIPEYMELFENYNTLQSQYSALETEVTELREFKVAAERKDKEAMIASFYMLSDEDKKDVLDNIDTYSLEDIEAKLSIICVRNKVSFDLDDNKEEKKEVVTYSMNDQLNDDSNVPAFVKAMRNVAKDM